MPARSPAAQAALPLFESEWWAGMPEAMLQRWINRDPTLSVPDNHDWHRDRPGDPECPPHAWRGGRRQVTDIRALEDIHLQHCWRLACTNRAHASRLGAVWAEMVRRGMEPPRYEAGATETVFVRRGSREPAPEGQPAPPVEPVLTEPEPTRLSFSPDIHRRILDALDRDDQQHPDATLVGCGEGRVVRMVRFAEQRITLYTVRRPSGIMEEIRHSDLSEEALRADRRQRGLPYARLELNALGRPFVAELHPGRPQVEPEQPDPWDEVDF